LAQKNINLVIPVGIPPDITEKINNFDFTFQKSCPVVCGGEIQELVDFHIIPVKN
jgi:hypothetical protein